MRGYENSWKSVKLYKQKVPIISVTFEGSGGFNGH